MKLFQVTTIFTQLNCKMITMFLSCSIHLFNQCKKIANAKKLRRYKSNISLIVEQILTFAWSPNIARELKSLSSSFKQIAWRSFELLNVLIRIVTSNLSINCKQFHQTFCSNILCIVDITCHFLTFWKKQCQKMSVNFST